MKGVPSLRTKRLQSLMRQELWDLGGDLGLAGGFLTSQSVSWS